jgi:hypothetical protein
VCSLLESPVGSPRLHVIDDHRFPLGRQADTPEQVVLFAPGRLAEHEARNLWWEAHQHVYGGYRKAYGVKPSVVRPESGCEFYSTRIQGNRLKVSILGKEVDASEMLRLTADRLLPRLAEEGIRRFFPIDAHASDVTELGMRRKLDAGIHGDHQCASVCSTHRFFPSPFWGGIKDWRYMARRARALGMEIGCWLAPHFSPRAAIFREHPDWLLRAPDTLYWGGGYSQAIVTADWNTGVYDWVLGDLERWAAEGGLDYIFIDSWANMGLVQWNCAERMRTNFDALARLLADIQKLGIQAYSFEGISPFGVSRFGCADLRGDLLDATAGIVGQNDFGWWVDDLDMAYDIGLHVRHRKRSAAEIRRQQFELMANRGIFIGSCQGQDYRVPPWSRRLNRVYEQALPHMKQRTLLPAGKGVRWDDGTTQVLWAYRDCAVDVPPGAEVQELSGGRPRKVACRKRLAAREGKVYRIG